MTPLTSIDRSGEENKAVKKPEKKISRMPMEQLSRNYEKDCLKMAMLKHEETFRQQVHDLHRLYRIQKLLMRDLKRGIKSHGQRSLSTSPNGSPEYNNNSNNNHRARALGVDDEEAELELTLAVGSGSGGGRKRYSDGQCSPGESFSSSSTESETTLTGGEWQMARTRQQLVAGGGHKRRPAGYDVAQDGGVQQQPLLFHWLSLRMA